MFPRSSLPAFRRHMLPRALGILMLLAIVVPAASSQTNAELQAELQRERAARLSLERRVAELEALMRGGATGGLSDLEAQLQGLLPPGDLAPAQARQTVAPSAFNPRIGVFVDAVVEGGPFDNKLGIADSDRFSVRETEVDVRLPISPFAEGVGVFSFEDEGGGSFEGGIEEMYADVDVGTLFDTDATANVRVGRFRPKFGRNNQLHTHDSLQVNQPLAVRHLIGEEGVIGDGLGVALPLGQSGDAPGTGTATTLDLALVNGEMVTGGETPFGPLAAGSLAAPAFVAPLTLDSDGPMAVGRLSHFMETGPVSDVEFGLSHIRRLDNDAVVTSAGTRIEPSWFGADLTVRMNDDETGVGGWLLQAETIAANVDFESSAAAMFPQGAEQRDGWWLTVQRQLSPNVHAGVRVGESEMFGVGDVDRAVSPYVSWYADEFFRIRAQVERLTRNMSNTTSIHGAWRALIQFSWNFGAHRPHPYWVNR